MTTPTNEDIITEIRKNHEENLVFQIKTDSRLSSIEAQVKKTNGRVSLLEQDKLQRDAITNYQRENPTVRNAEQVTIENYWNDPKLVATVSTLLTAAATYIITKGSL